MIKKSVTVKSENGGVSSNQSIKKSLVKKKIISVIPKKG